MRNAIDIIIPFFNSEQYIEETIHSILKQTIDNYIVILVDDGSTDNSNVILTRLIGDNNKFKTVKRTTEPKGPSSCRNIGILQSKSKYIVFLDSDDLITPSFVENRLNYMNEHSDLDFAIFQMATFIDHIDNIQSIITKESTDYLKDFLTLNDIVWTVTSPIWKREFIIALDGFSEVMTIFEDPDLSIRALLKTDRYQVNFNNSPDCFYRLSSTPGKRDICKIDVNYGLLIKSIIKSLTDNKRKIEIDKYLKSCYAHINIKNADFDIRKEDYSNIYSTLSSINKALKKNKSYSLLEFFSWQIILIAIYKLRLFDKKSVRAIYRMFSYVMYEYTLTEYIKQKIVKIHKNRIE